MGKQTRFIKAPENVSGTYRSRDMYLTAFLMLEGATLHLAERLDGKDVLLFVVTHPDSHLLEQLVSDYYSDVARVSPKQLKHKVTDIKNSMYSLLDNK